MLIIQRQSDEPIAVVGSGLPPAGRRYDLEAYWQLLRSGHEAITEIPPERWALADWYDSDPAATNKMYVRHAALLDKLADFDAAFFRISPREAHSIDPQHRLLLEVGWEALEHAGIAPQTLENSDSGVFIGITANEYASLVRQSPELLGHVVSGSPLNVAAGRLSFTLGWRGPAQAWTPPAAVRW